MKHNLDYLGLPEPSAGVIDRIRYLIKLSRKTQTEFSRLVGMDPANLSKILSGRLPVSDGFINRIVVNLNVSKDWLVNGTDVPFPRTESPHAVTFPADSKAVVTPSKAAGAPIYDIDVTAGCQELSRMFTDERIIGYLDLPGINPGCPILRVSGDSMDPAIKNGAYISIRPVSDSGIISWGQIYVVIVEDYRFVKYVRRHPDKNTVILHSANPDYDDIELPRKDIIALYLVEMIMNYDIIA